MNNKKEIVDRGEKLQKQVDAFFAASKEIEDRMKQFEEGKVPFNIFAEWVAAEKKYWELLCDLLDAEEVLDREWLDTLPDI